MHRWLCFSSAKQLKGRCEAGTSLTSHEGSRRLSRWFPHHGLWDVNYEAIKGLCALCGPGERQIGHSVGIEGPDEGLE